MVNATEKESPVERAAQSIQLAIIELRVALLSATSTSDALVVRQVIAEAVEHLQRVENRALQLSDVLSGMRRSA